jgi:hypothetical protein
MRFAFGTASVNGLRSKIRKRQENRVEQAVLLKGVVAIVAALKLYLT